MSKNLVVGPFPQLDMEWDPSTVGVGDVHRDLMFRRPCGCYIRYTNVVAAVGSLAMESVHSKMCLKRPTPASCAACLINPYQRCVLPCFPFFMRLTNVSFQNKVPMGTHVGAVPLPELDVDETHPQRWWWQELTNCQATGVVLAGIGQGLNLWHLIIQIFHLHLFMVTTRHIRIQNQLLWHKLGGLRELTGHSS